MPPHDEWRRIICTWVRNQRNFRTEPIRPCCRSGPWSGHQLSVYQQSGSIQFVRISTSWLVFSCAAEITKFFRHLYIAKKGCESAKIISATLWRVENWSADMQVSSSQYYPFESYVLSRKQANSQEFVRRGCILQSTELSNGACWVRNYSRPEDQPVTLQKFALIMIGWLATYFAMYRCRQNLIISALHNCPTWIQDNRLRFIQIF